MFFEPTMIFLIAFTLLFGLPLTFLFVRGMNQDIRTLKAIKAREANQNRDKTF